MTTVEDFKSCLEELRVKYGVSSLKLNADNACFLEHNSGMYIRIQWNYANCLQLHANVLTLNASQTDDRRIYKLLLVMNNDDIDMNGGYFSFNPRSNAVSYNIVQALTEINPLKVETVLNNFLKFSLAQKEKLEKQVNAIQGDHSQVDPNANQLCHNSLLNMRA